MVCLGNICRSPVARVALEAAAAARGGGGGGPVVEVDSCGTIGAHAGEKADARMRRTAKAHGLDLERHRARQLRRGDFDEFDLVLCMDRSNLEDVRRVRPDGSRAEVRLLLEYAPGRAETEVPDPYYGGDQGFEDVFRMVTDAAEGVLRAVGPAE